MGHGPCIESDLYVPAVERSGTEASLSYSTDECPHYSDIRPRFSMGGHPSHHFLVPDLHLNCSTETWAFVDKCTVTDEFDVTNPVRNVANTG